MEVIGAERGAVRELETVHALDRTKRLGLERFEQGFEQGFDLVADLVADLVGSRHCSEGGENGGEEEINEGGRVADLITGCEYPVLVSLAVADHRLDREKGEQRVPVAE